jgi:quercetin dioxygenase-like cupin family protein
MEHITSTPTAKAPAERFNGDVYLNMIEAPAEPARLATALVRFTPGARTNWHSHANGQTLYITDGIGLVGTRDGNTQEIRPGDVVFIDPDEEHWHGATPDRFMSHVALNEADEQGQVVTWLEPVADEDYTS